MSEVAGSRQHDEPRVGEQLDGFALSRERRDAVALPAMSTVGTVTRGAAARTSVLTDARNASATVRGSENPLK
ncbi:hypothetical protein GCM10025869_31520 [Homoserinibacter gongjuensis]|uniref:Uncharacterized protein n=1 Tax=Homoserinibacter gongjuensis TaxID=1162968 RepID=A0ABQ6JWE4_9MICO|nr:hypothetical protein GCM10025869_31520 [Homoserinibacter gongjuensis]